MGATRVLDTGEDAPPGTDMFAPTPIRPGHVLHQGDLDYARYLSGEYAADIRLGVKVPSMWAAVTR